MASYIENNLMENEEIKYEAELSNWAYGWQIFFGIILTPILIGFLILLAFYLSKISTELAITNKRVIVKTGFIQRNTIEISLKKVESIQVEQDIFGRMFDFGTVIVSGAGNPQAPLKFISKPLEFRKNILSLQDQLS